jgi:hypothetical protein
MPAICDKSDGGTALGVCHEGLMLRRDVHHWRGFGTRNSPAFDRPRRHRFKNFGKEGFS